MLLARQEGIRAERERASKIQAHLSKPKREREDRAREQ